MSTRQVGFISTQLLVAGFLLSNDWPLNIQIMFATAGSAWVPNVEQAKENGKRSRTQAHFSGVSLILAGRPRKSTLALSSGVRKWSGS